MKKNIVYTTLSSLLMCAAFSGCSKGGDVTPTVAPSQKPAATLTMYGDYAQLAGHMPYSGKDNAYLIQLPEGCDINEEDPDNVIITIPNEFGQTDTINIKYEANAQVIDTEAQLMEMLKNDDSIDITGFFVLTKDNAYEGYKYTCTATSDAEFKSIKSVYFADDRSAYVITASSPNGGDDINMTALNTVVDTFICYK